jgi:hypothetical protein
MVCSFQLKIKRRLNESRHCAGRELLVISYYLSAGCVKYGFQCLENTSRGMAHLDPVKRQNGSLWRSNVSMISPAQAGRAYFLPGREKIQSRCPCRTAPSEASFAVEGRERLKPFPPQPGGLERGAFIVFC